jgi:hypothetical protein
VNRYNLHGKKLTSEELCNNDFSKYALADIDPCDTRRNKMHWFYLSQFINHGNYTVANICFETNLVSHCIKPLCEDMELFVDYRRPIYCKKCVEYRKVAGKIKLGASKQRYQPKETSAIVIDANRKERNFWQENARSVTRNCALIVMTTSRYPCSCKQFATIYRNIFKLQINNRYFTLITVIKISLIFISKQENLKRLIKK